jgi:integrase
MNTNKSAGALREQPPAMAHEEVTLMSRTNRSRRIGIEEREDAAGREQYRGHVYDRRAKRKIRGEWTYSLAAAKNWRNDALTKLEAGLLSADRGDTIAVAADVFIAAARSGEARTRSGDRYKPSAIRNYEQGFRLRIVPAIGASRLADVRTADLQRLVRRWQGEGVNPSTIRNTMNALRALYRQAVAHGDCHTNPTQGVMLPAVRGKRDRIEPPEIAEQLVAALEFPERALWATAFEAGLRNGELRAVEWEHVDLEARTIRVHGGWDAVEGPIDPKSRAGWRTVPMTGDLHVILTEHRRLTQRIHGLVFGRTATIPFAPSTADTRAARAWKAAGLRGIGLHEARHTYASYLIAAGVDMKAISEYMGHSSVAFTYDRYGHLLPGSTAENAAKLDAYLARARSHSRSHED